MKKIKFLILLISILSGHLIFSQNYVTYTPQVQTVTANSGSEITVSVVASCYGNLPSTISINPTFCVTDEGLKSVNFSNGTYLTPGQSSTITFKFKKIITSNSSFTYKFSKENGSCSIDSNLIKITVNYNYTAPITCSLPYPQNFNISNIQTSSIQYNWDGITGAASYKIGYKISNGGNWNYISINNPQTLGNLQFGYTLNGLQSGTKYDVFVVAVCPNGISGDTGYGLTAATGSSSVVTTLCPVLLPPTNLAATPYSYGYYITFNQAPNIFSYWMELVDLTNNSSWTTNVGYYSSTVPSYNSNFFYGIPLDHPFKFRLYYYYNSCPATYSDWKFINPPPLYCTSIPTNLILSSQCGSLKPSVCGAYVRWDSISTSTDYQFEYLIYNPTSGQSRTGTNVCSSNSFTISADYVSGTWFAKFRVKSKCSNGVWSDYSPWSNNFVWN